MPVQFDVNALVNRSFKAANRGRVVLTDTADTVGTVKAWITGVGSTIAAIVALLCAFLALRSWMKNRKVPKGPTDPPMGVWAGGLSLGTVILGMCAAYQFWVATSNNPYATYTKRMSGAMTTATAAGDVWDAFRD